MIRKISRVLAISTLVLAGLATAASAQQTSPVQKIKIDFDFYAGKKLMPAGEYLVRLTPADAFHKLVQLQQVKGNETAIVMSVPSPNKNTLNRGALSFNKYGDQYYLSGVQIGETGTIHTVIKTRAEKRLLKGIAKNAADARPETVTTQSTGQ